MNSCMVEVREPFHYRCSLFWVQGSRACGMRSHMKVLLVRASPESTGWIRTVNGLSSCAFQCQILTDYLASIFLPMTLPPRISESITPLLPRLFSILVPPTPMGGQQFWSRSMASVSCKTSEFHKFDSPGGTGCSMQDSKECRTLQ